MGRDFELDFMFLVAMGRDFELDFIFLVAMGRDFEWRNFFGCHEKGIFVLEHSRF
jgi:hypothetical protein